MPMRGLFKRNPLTLQPPTTKMTLGRCKGRDPKDQEPMAAPRTQYSCIVGSVSDMGNRRRPHMTMTLAEAQAYLDGVGKVHQSKETPTMMKIAEAIEAY